MYFIDSHPLNEDEKSVFNWNQKKNHLCLSIIENE